MQCSLAKEKTFLHKKLKAAVTLSACWLTHFMQKDCQYLAKTQSSKDCTSQSEDYSNHKSECHITAHYSV